MEWFLHELQVEGARIDRAHAEGAALDVFVIDDWEWCKPRGLHEFATAHGRQIQKMREAGFVLLACEDKKGQRSAVKIGQ